MSLLMIIILGSLFITGCYDNKKRVITEKEQKIIDETRIKPRTKVPREGRINAFPDL